MSELVGAGQLKLDAAYDVPKPLKAKPGSPYLTTVRHNRAVGRRLECLHLQVELCSGEVAYACAEGCQRCTASVDRANGCVLKQRLTLATQAGPAWKIGPAPVQDE